MAYKSRISRAAQAVHVVTDTAELARWHNLIKNKIKIIKEKKEVTTEIRA